MGHTLLATHCIRARLPIKKARVARPLPRRDSLHHYPRSVSKAGRVQGSVSKVQVIKLVYDNKLTIVSRNIGLLIGKSMEYVIL